MNAFRLTATQNGGHRADGQGPPDGHDRRGGRRRQRGARHQHGQSLVFFNVSFCPEFQLFQADINTVGVFFFNVSFLGLDYTCAKNMGVGLQKSAKNSPTLLPFCVLDL